MKLKACNLKSHSITTTTPLPSLCGEMGFYLDISGNQDATVKLKTRLIFYVFDGPLLTPCQRNVLKKLKQPKVEKGCFKL